MKCFSSKIVLTTFILIFAGLVCVHAAENTFQVGLTIIPEDNFAPSIPANLNATPVSSSQIDLSWDASTDDYIVSGYRIFRDGSIIASTTSLVYSDTGLAASTLYTYEVEAYDTVLHYSGTSTPYATTTLAAPIVVIPPVTPPSTGGGSSGGYARVLVSGVTVSPTRTSATVNFTTNVPTQAKVFWGKTAEYELGSISGLFYDYHHTIVIDGLTPGTQYHYRIEATNSVGMKGDATGVFVSVPGVAPIMLSNVTGFRATSHTADIGLTWNNPTQDIFDSVRVVRSDKFFPRDITEGQVVYEGRGQSYTDTDVVVGTKYYYSIFARDTSGTYTSGALAEARIVLAGEIAITPGSTDPFIGISVLKDVDPIIAQLSLSDFDFYQAGRKLTNVGGTIGIDGSENVTIRLDYDKVPEILKTIAITLTDPTDPTGVFPFLLRVNADKTAYEATIAPLGTRGQYRMNIVVLDYKNQGLKRLDGNLRAFVFGAAGDLIGSEKGISYGVASLFLALILALILILRMVYRKYRRPLVAATLSLVILISGCGSIVTAHAAYNPMINYQGKLTTAANVAVADGLYTMEFKLYTAPTGGSTLWTETDNGSNKVQVTNGLFSVMLGSTTPFTGVDFNQTLYLGVKIEADSEMTPRKLIGTVPAAFYAATSSVALSAQTAVMASSSDTLSGLNSTQFFRTDAQNATSSSSTFLNILQSGAGKIAEFFGAASQSVLAILSNGNVGIGTTSPYAKLSVVGEVVGQYFTATSTTASIFPYASTTAFTVSGTASTSALIVSNSATVTALTLGSLTGPLQAINGAVSASSTLSVVYGGTGLSTAPTYGQLLLGQADGTYALTSTSSLNIATGSLVGTLGVAQGGTGQTSFGQGWVGINDSGAFVSSTSPTVNYITATSTTATSTFAYDISVDGALRLIQTGTNALILGDVTGNARGSSALDIQSSRTLVTSVASGVNSIAVGNDNRASGTGSIAIGATSTASGTNSLSVGVSNTASASSISLAFGRSNTASGNSSSAFGYGNTSSNTEASAFGRSNTASGNSSSAFGYSNTASATNASIFGSSITNSIANSTMIGPSDAAKLTILSTGETKASYFTATSTTASTFPYASTTVLTSSGSAYLATGNGGVLIGTTTVTSTSKLTIAGGNVVHTASGNPAFNGSAALSGSGAYKVSVVGKYAYVTDSGSGLSIVDVSNPSSPAVIGTYNTAGTAVGVSVAGEYAYVADTFSGIAIVDVSNPTSPTLVSQYSDTGRSEGIFVSGKYAYVAGYSGGLRIVDISDPTSPALKGTYTTATSITEVFVSGKYAYVGSGSHFYIIDISNPTSPSLVGTYATSASVTDIYVSGRYAYFSCSVSGLCIVDVSNPASPSLVGSYDLPYAGGTTGVFVAGKYAYMADGTSGMYVLDISNPATPFMIGLYDTPNIAVGVYVSGKHAYVADGNSLQIIDINGIETPSLYAGNIETNVLNATENIVAGGDIYAQGGLNVGISGIFSRGGLGVFVGSTTAANPIAATFMGGNVGIGTTSPYAKLSVVGEIVGSYFTGTTTATSTFGGNLAINGTGTTTSAGGFNLSAGCFAVNGTCLTNNTYGDSNVNVYIHASTTIPKTYTANTFTALQTFQNASSTLLSSNYASTTNLFAGSIGIGIQSAAYPLHVNGNVKIEDGSVIYVPEIRSSDDGLAARITLTDEDIVMYQDTTIFPGTVNAFSVFKTDSVTRALSVDGSTGNVGIGTQSAPGSNLSVQGNAVIGSAYAALVAPTNSLLVEGNVGIGTTSPYAKLSVVGEIVGSYFTGTTTATSTFGGNLAINGTGTTTSAGGFNLSAGCFAVNGTCLANNTYGDSNVNAYIHASTTIPKTYTANIFSALQTFGNASTTQLSVSGNTYFPGGIWNSSGNVGIGTTSPWGLLSVNPNGISGPSFAVGSSTETNFMIGNDGNTYIGSSTKLSYSVLSAPSGHLIMDDLRAFSMRNKSGGNGANVYFWTDHDSNGGELIMNSAHNIAIVPGINGNLTGNIQIGNTSATNDTITFQRNGTADSGTLTTPSKKILFANSYWNGSAVVYPYLSMRSLVTNTGFQSLNWYYDDPGTNSPSYNAGIGTQMATLSSTGFSAITINATSTATSTFAGSIAVTENATSTFAGGIDISAGCIAVGGVCVTGTGSSYGDSDVNSYIHASTTIPKTYTANTFSALQTIPYASTTMISSSIASTSQLIVDRGTTFLTPTIAFNGDLNTGFYSSASDVIDFVTAGQQQWQILSSGTLYAPNGDGVSTAGSFFAGSYLFASDIDSGFSRISDGVLGLTNNGNSDNYYFSANRTGFGSTTPLARLTASSSVDVTAIFDQRGTSDILQLQDSGQSVFVVKDGGNVGIGTTSPYAKLSVVGGIVTDNIITTSRTATSSFAGPMQIGTTSPVANSTALKTLYLEGAANNYNVSSAGILQINSLGDADSPGTSEFSRNRGLFFGIDTNTVSNAGSGFIQYYGGTGANPARNLALNPNGGGVVLNGITGETSTSFPTTIIGNASANALVKIQNISTAGGSLSTPYAGFTFQTYNTTSTYQKGGIVYQDKEGGSCCYLRGQMKFLLNPTASGANVQDTVEGSTIMTLGFKNGYGTASTLTNQVVGIGSTTPYAKLSIHALSNEGNDTLFAVASSTASATTTHFVIKATGETGIGTTSPWRKFAVTGTVGLDGLTAAVASGDALCLSAGKELIVNTGAQTCTVSSARFKNSVSGLNIGLDQLKRLRPVSFKYNGSDDPRVGFLAEEVGNVDNRMIFTESDGVTPRGVRYEDMVSLVVKAVQEQQMQIEDIALNMGINLQSVSSGLSASTTAEIASTTADILASSTPSFITRVAGAVQEYIASAGEWVVAKLTAHIVYTDRIETQVAAVSKGLEMTDAATGNIYCVQIKNGDWDKKLGSCTTPASTPTSTTTVPSIDTGTQGTPPVVGTTTTSGGGDTAATSTSPTDTSTSTAPIINTDPESTQESTDTGSTTQEETPPADQGSSSGTTTDTTSVTTEDTSTEQPAPAPETPTDTTSSTS